MRTIVDLVTGAVTLDPDYTPEPRDLAAERAAWREGAAISRSEFVLACYRAGILTKEEAVVAGKGDMAPPFAAALARVDPALAAEGEIVWAGTPTVRRSSPFVDLVAAEIGYSPEQVDALFGGPPA